MAELHVSQEMDPKDKNSISFEARKRQIEEDERLEKEEHERRKKSPYRSWIQMNKDAYKAEDWLMSKSPIAYRIFKFLINSMDTYNAVMCSQTVIQEHFGVSRMTVSRAIKLLKEKQYIDVYKSGTSNVYAVNKQIAWSSWGTNYKHGKFGANIIISESEQENDVRLKIEKHHEVTIKDNNRANCSSASR